MFLYSVEEPFLFTYICDDMVAVVKMIISVIVSSFTLSGTAGQLSESELASVSSTSFAWLWTYWRSLRGASIFIQYNHPQHPKIIQRFHFQSWTSSLDENPARVKKKSNLTATYFSKPETQTSWYMLVHGLSSTVTPFCFFVLFCLFVSNFRLETGPQFRWGGPQWTEPIVIAPWGWKWGAGLCQKCWFVVPVHPCTVAMGGRVFQSFSVWLPMVQNWTNSQSKNMFCCQTGSFRY